MAQKLKILTIIFSIIFGFVFMSPAVLAEETCTPGKTAHPLNSDGAPDLGQCDPVKDPKQCATGALLKIKDKNGALVTDTTKCEPLGNGCADKTDQECLQDNPIVKDLNIIVGFLSGLVGVAVVGAIILGGVQYAMAGDKAEAVSAAKKRIINGLIALVAFLFIFAFLQWLIPGGIFK